VASTNAVASVPGLEPQTGGPGTDPKGWSRRSASWRTVPQASSTGFEPVISCVTGRRALQAAPWKESRTVLAFYVLPEYRTRAFALFDEFLNTADCKGMEVQSNDALVTVMLHTIF
jgi:hypothetical protein